MIRYRILVPLDGSKHSAQSLIYLRALARIDESEVLLLSVVDDTEEFRKAIGAEAQEREKTLLKAYLHEVSTDLAKHGIKSRTKLRFGRPADQILEEAHTFFPHLIVMPTHGRSGFSRWRLGSIADKVIRGADCNTLVIGSNAKQKDSWWESDVEPAFKSILVPLDGSVLADEALPVAQFFAEKFDSRLHLVRVISLPIVGNESGYVVEAICSAASAHVASMAKRQDVAREATAEVLVGSAASELCRYVQENNIDLIVMTSHGRSGMMRAALGSVTDRMLDAPAPVLIVRPERGESPARTSGAR